MPRIYDATRRQSKLACRKVSIVACAWPVHWMMCWMRLLPLKLGCCTCTPLSCQTITYPTRLLPLLEDQLLNHNWCFSYSAKTTLSHRMPRSPSGLRDQRLPHVGVIFAYLLVLSILSLSEVPLPWTPFLWCMVFGNDTEVTNMLCWKALWYNLLQPPWPDSYPPLLSVLGQIAYFCHWVQILCSVKANMKLPLFLIARIDHILGLGVFEVLSATLPIPVG